MQTIKIRNGYKVAVVSQWGIAFVVRYCGKTFQFKTLEGALNRAKNLVGRSSLDIC